MIAIIPARGGSKGLPGKNIKKLCGKPLIAYTIEEALKSDKIKRVIVSTDSENIANIAIQYGAEVPFLRPEKLAGDHAKAVDNYLYTIERISKEENRKINEFIVLQPTSPLRKARHINEAIECFYKNNAHSVVSVKKAEHPPEWYKTIDQNGILKDYISDENALNRQEYPQTYLPNGAIFIFKYDILKENRTYYTNQTYPYLMNKESSIDIDTLYDFLLATTIIKMDKFEYEE